jgi:hypothetical protein
LKLRSEDLVFLHRLSVGVPLLGRQEVCRLKARVDRRSLCRVLFDRAAAIIPGQAADIAGLMDAGDVDSAAVSAQRLLGGTLDAVLAVNGDSNPSEKWRLRRLRDHFNRGLTRALPDVLQTFASYPATRDLFLLRSWPGMDRPDALMEYAHACARLGRHAIPWGQRALQGSAAPPVHREPLHGRGLTNSPGMSLALPRLAPDVMLRWRGEVLVLFTAGGQTEMEVGPVTEEALTLFDGRTPLGVAAARLAAGRPVEPAAMVQALIDLRTVLTAHGLAETASARAGTTPEVSGALPEV